MELYSYCVAQRVTLIGMINRLAKEARGMGFRPNVSHLSYRSGDYALQCAHARLAALLSELCTREGATFKIRLSDLLSVEGFDPSSLLLEETARRMRVNTHRSLSRFYKRCHV